MSTLNEKNTTIQDGRIASTTSHLGIPQVSSRLATLRFFSSVLADLHAYLVHTFTLSTSYSIWNTRSDWEKCYAI